MENVPERAHALTPITRRTMPPAIPGVPLDIALATARRVLADSEALDPADDTAICMQLGALEFALVQLVASAGGEER